MILRLQEINVNQTKIKFVIMIKIVIKNDDGYDIYADHEGNIYERTDGDWTKGHGHRNDSTNYDRDKNSDKSRGRSWKNPWLKYSNKLNLTQEEVEILNILYNHRENAQTLKKEKSKTLTKRR